MLLLVLLVLLLPQSFVSSSSEVPSSSKALLVFIFSVDKQSADVTIGNGVNDVDSKTGVIEKLKIGVDFEIGVDFHFRGRMDIFRGRLNPQEF